MRALAVSLLLVLAAAPAASRDRTPDDPQAALAKRLAGFTAQHPVSCIPNSDTRFAHTEGYGRTIVYEVNRNFLYRTETDGGCESMGHGDYLVVRSNGGQVCKGDIAQTFDPLSRVPTGSCSLGEFTPYHRQ